ncbi:MAG: hypothetical protein LBM41_04790, partial [Ruminococcus sp.]|nr:hypothetical protein [Ruminococcus sp.]
EPEAQPDRKQQQQKPEPKPEPKQEAPKKQQNGGGGKPASKFGFDLSELESLSKLVEGSAGNDSY